MIHLESRNDFSRFSMFSFSPATILLWFLSFYLVVDTLNGWMMRDGLFSVSMPYKILMLIFSFFVFKSYLAFISWILFVFFLIMVRVYDGADIVSALSGLDWLLKFIFIPIFTLCFLKHIRKSGNLNSIFFLAKVSFSILLLNVLLGTVGIGYTAYSSSESSIGAKGFIYAGNELGVALLVSGGLIMVDFISKKRYFMFCLFSFIFIIASALTAVKVAFLSALLMFFLFPIFCLYVEMKKYRVTKRTLLFSVALTVVAPAIIFSSIYFLLFHVGLWERIEFFMNRVDLVTMIFSGRNQRAEIAISIFFQNYSLYEQMFGQGILWLNHPLVTDQVEIDFFDFLMRYGILGALVPYLFMFVICGYAFINIKNNEIGIYVFLMVILVVAVSLVAGHVLYAGTAAPLIAALFSLSFIKLEKDYISGHTA